MRTLIATTVALTIVSSVSIAQLSGTYTIGGGGDYADFGEAVSDLLTQGVDGAVFFSVAPGTYTPSDVSQAIIHIDVQIPGISESNRVTFEPDFGNGGTVDNVILERTSGSETATGGIFAEIRSDYVTIRNMTMNYADTLTDENVGSAVYVREEVANNTTLDEVEVIGCKINGFSGTSRVFAGVRHWNNNTDCIIRDNIIDGALNGIYFADQSAWSQGTVIEGNMISDTRIWLTGGSEPMSDGIKMGPGVNVIIRSNVIDYGGTTQEDPAQGAKGINISGATDITIDRNHVKDILWGQGTQPNDVFTAIYLFGVTGGVVTNNMVSQIHPATRHGITVANSENVDVIHNTVRHPHRDIGSWVPANAIQLDGTGHRVLNNIIFDYSTAGNYASALRLIDTAGIVCDYNNIVAPSTAVSAVNLTFFTTLEDWQATGFDSNSVSKDVTFADNVADLHLAECSIADEDIRGIPLVEVPFDIDGEVRDSETPFMGADETDGELPGLFSSPLSYPTGDESWRFTAGDLDGDGDADLALSNAITGSDNTISILWNDGGAGFSAPDHLFFGDDPYSPKTAFLNSDNLLDLIITTGDSVWLRLNAGNGSFDPPVAIPPVTLQGFKDASIVDVGIGDLDNDGDEDLLTSNNIAGFPDVAMYPYLNTGTGLLYLRDDDHILVEGVFIDQIFLVEMNGDEFLDAILVDAISTNKVYVVMNLGLDGNDEWLGFEENGTELPDQVYSVTGHSTIMIEDFDGDTDRDIIIRDAWALDTLIQYTNNGGGNFSSSKFHVHSTHTGNVYTAIDYDGDGYMDIASANNTEDLHVLINDGTGSFDLVMLCEASSFGSVSRAIVSGHFDGDTRKDLAVLTVNDTVNVYTNLGWIPTGVDNDPPPLVREYKLFQNYPNPFNPTTVISYSLPVSSHVTLKIYNILGQEVAKLVDVTQEAGYRRAEWNANSVASGVYFYRIEARAVSTNQVYSNVKKMLLIR